jgi:hypothetical protein
MAGGRRHAVSITFAQIGTDAKPVEPHAFQTAYGVGPDGATLVRPDGYIAWRATTAPTDRTQALTTALSRTAAPARPVNA